MKLFIVTTATYNKGESPEVNTFVSTRWSNAVAMFDENIEDLGGEDPGDLGNVMVDPLPVGESITTGSTNEDGGWSVTIGHYRP